MFLEEGETSEDEDQKEENSDTREELDPKHVTRQNSKTAEGDDDEEPNEESELDTHYHRPSELASKQTKQKAMADLLSRRQNKKQGQANLIIHIQVKLEVGSPLHYLSACICCLTLTWAIMWNCGPKNFFTFHIKNVDIFAVKVDIWCIDGSDRKTNVSQCQIRSCSATPKTPRNEFLQKKIFKKKNFGTKILHDCPNVATIGWASLEVTSIELIQNVTSLFVHNAKTRM